MSSRREFIKASLAASAVASLGWSQKLLAKIADPKVLRYFPNGVASGDPTKESVVIWTKIATQSPGAQTVDWQISEDADFTKIVSRGALPTNQYLDYTMKVDVIGLSPGKHYFYRFNYMGVSSETGRTRTLPEGRLDSLSLAVVSCSNFPFGFFNGYEEIATDSDIDFVVHLGDYIYEYGRDSYGGETGRAIGREHEPAHEIVTLADYRQRHAQYKADRASRMMHAAYPIIAIWDDHESANNPFVSGAENHQPEAEGSWYSRREASLQAYYEWMPIREPSVGLERQQYWRSFEFGDLASLTTLETRHTGRSEQIDYTKHIPSIDSDSQRQHFVENILGDQTRTMLSPAMSQYYQRSLKSSVDKNIRWQLVGNQIPLARTHMPDVSKLEVAASTADSDYHRQFLKLGELDLPLYTDTWDGYPAAREAFYDLTRKAGVDNILVLTGDSHSFWFNQLFDASGVAMGVELGTAGITSPGDFESLGDNGAALMDELIAQHNKEVVWTDGRHRGFIKLTLTKEKAQADYVAVDTILSETYAASSIKTVDIYNKSGKLEY